jgi:glycosyltransferase involved in cell wall biosynthesis
LKLAFVVQRFGADIAGGSEAHCRELALRLAGHHEITVLTTCARDYVTWANALPAGESREGSLRVLRFPVARQRRMKEFADLDDQMRDGADPAQQEAWFRENGPIVPGLLEHLRQYGTTYDVVLFWTFRYYPSFFGLPLVADRAVLVPTAEEDLTVTLSVLEDFFRRPAGYLFMTPEEEALVAERAGRPLHPSATIGMGLEPVTVADRRAVLDRHRVPANYILYLGRVDRNKGCPTLFDYFQDYAVRDRELTLVLAGPAKIRIPSHPRILPLGYVSDELRVALLTHALALVVPSPYESLSIVLLEAWNYGVPAVVNAFCKVLRGQVRRANGGLYYQSSREFAEAVEFLRTHPRERTALGDSGRAFVEREYRWPTIVARVEALLAEVTARRATVTAAAAPREEASPG